MFSLSFFSIWFFISTLLTCVIFFVRIFGLVHQYLLIPFLLFLHPLVFQNFLVKFFLPQILIRLIYDVSVFGYQSHFLQMFLFLSLTKKTLQIIISQSVVYLHFFMLKATQIKGLFLLFHNPLLFGLCFLLFLLRILRGIVVICAFFINCEFVVNFLIDIFISGFLVLFLRLLIIFMFLFFLLS